LGYRGMSDQNYAARRRPQSTMMEEATIASPTVMKPTVTRLSSQARALRPAAKIGDIAPVPKMAASVVNAQFAYVP